MKIAPNAGDRPMHKITIEEDGRKHVYIGTITKMDLGADAVETSPSGSWRTYARTGSGDLSIAMKYINGKNDLKDLDDD